MNINNKGFTLIELIGVIAILAIILLVAIPNIASTYERKKHEIDEKKKEIIYNAVSMYANLYKSEFNYNEYLKGNCGISVDMLKDKELITEDELKSSTGSKLYEDNAIIVYNSGKLSFSTSVPECSKFLINE